MNKKIAFCGSILVYCAGMLFPQSFGSVDNGTAKTETVVDDQKGFTAQVDIDTNLFQATQEEFSDAKARFREGENLHRTNYFLIDNYPFGGFNVLDDTNVGFAYNGDWYGGNLSVNSGGLGGIKAWLSFFDGKIKISAGNDIGYSYADSQGADAGLRVFDDNIRTSDRHNENVNSNKNPDNITQDKGILFEFNLDPLKIALAGGGNIADFSKNIGSLQAATNDDPLYGHSFQYGINVGGKIGEIAKINGAYILQAVKKESEYTYNSTAGKIIAGKADAETWNHLFGVYASYYPWGGDRLGITLGYAGEFIKYLEEFEINSTTTVPQIFKHGINLMARYKTEKLTIKTDHNYSFWTDKNYNIYNLYNPAEDKMKDYGLLADTSGASGMADVSHTFLWNGIGATYQFTPVIEGAIYTRNLLRTDETPEYKMTTMYFFLSLKSTFRLGPQVEAYAEITWEYKPRTVSEGLARASGEFGANPVRETRDVKNEIRIPVGFKVKLQ